MAGSLFKAKAAFSCVVNGQNVVVTSGELVSADDPVRKGREASFEEVAPSAGSKARSTSGAPAVKRRTRVEQATSEPGERRDLTSPPRPPVTPPSE